MNVKENFLKSHIHINKTFLECYLLFSNILINLTTQVELGLLN